MKGKNCIVDFRKEKQLLVPIGSFEKSMAREIGIVQDKLFVLGI